MRKIAILSLFTIFLFGQSSKQDDILRSKFGEKEFDDINHIANRVDNSEKSFNSPPKLFKSSFANNAPTFISSSSDSVNLFNGSVPYNFNVLTNDPDGDALTISIASNPSWLSLSSVTGGNKTDISSPYQFVTSRTSGDYLGLPRGIKFYNGSLYVAVSDQILKVNLDGSSTLIAGTGGEGYTGDGGAAVDANLNYPYGLDIDSNGNLYFADYSNHVIRKVDTNGVITTVAGTGGEGYSGDGGAATSAELNNPADVVIDSDGNIYIADADNYRIRKIAPNGVITTLAGTGDYGYSGDGGVATSANLGLPTGLAIDSNGNLYYSDFGQHVIRKIATNGVISTVAGTGTAGNDGDGGAATSAKLDYPWGLSIDASNNLFVGGSHSIRKVDTDGVITTISGTSGSSNFSGDGGTATNAQLNNAEYIAFDSNGNSYISDTSNQRIRKIDSDGNISTIAGRWAYYADNVPFTDIETYIPRNMWIDKNDNLFIAEQNYCRILKVNTSGVVTTVAGNGSCGFAGDGGLATNAELNGPRGVIGDNAGNIFIADRGNHRIRKVDIYGNISTVAGTGDSGYTGDGGAATSAQLNGPYNFAFFNTDLYIADLGNHVIRKLDFDDGTISTVAGTGEDGYSGDGGAATSAKFSNPTAIAFDSKGIMYIADYSNHIIRKVDTDGNISTFAGTGTGGYSGDDGEASSAKIDNPINLIVDKADNVIFVHWSSSSPVIRKVWKGSYIVTTIVGTGVSGYSTNKNANEVLIARPQGLALDSKENLYFGDQSNRLISKVDASYHTLSGTPTLTDVATETMTLTASDGNGGSATQAFTLKVQNRSDYLSFDGIDDYATIPDTYNALDGLTDDSFTVSLWAKPIGLREANDGQIFARQGWHIGVEYTKDRKFRFRAWDADNVDYTIETAQSYFNTWHHLAMMYQKSTKTANFYVDGSLVGEAVLNKDLLAYDSDYFFGSVHLSNDYNLKYPYSGGLDQISFWNRALDSAQINKIYSGTRDGDILTFASDNSVLTNLTAYYPINNDDNVATLVDYSGNGFNGSISSALMSTAAKAIDHSITLTTPNGGEFINQNDKYNISWTATGYGIKHIKIEVSYDGGSSYSSINDSTENDYFRSFNSIVNKTSRDSKIRASIIDTSGNVFSDESDYTFSAFKVDIYNAQTTNIEMPIRNDGVSGKHVSNNDIKSLLFPRSSSNEHLYFSKFVWTSVNPSSEVIGTGKPYTRHEYHPVDSLSVKDFGLYTEIKGKFQDVTDSIIVEQRALVPNGFPDTDDNYIVMEYIVENRTGLDLGETYLGSFYDIDINDYRENQTGWLKNSTNNQNIAYTRDSNLSGTEWLSYIGVHSINDDMYMSRYKSSNDPSSTTEMIEIMKDKSENKPSSSDENGDYRMIMSKKLTSFNNGQKDTLLFAILAGDGTANLYYQKANTLISNMNTYGQPPVIEAISEIIINEDNDATFTPTITDDLNTTISFTAESADTSLLAVEIIDGSIKIMPKANMHGTTSVEIKATDGFLTSTVSFNVTINPVQDAPTDFNWVSTASDSILISQSNLASTYDLEWTESNDVDGDSINYLLFAKIGVYEEEEIWDTTSTKVQISYSEILEGVFEGQPINAATVKFIVKSTDGIDTVNVTGDDRVLYVSRYEYLSTESDLLPTEYALHENFPNPFNPSTTLRFDLPYAGDVSLTIYNMLGQKVKSFDMRGIQAGKHTLRWNATNDLGEKVSTGVYLYQLQTKDFMKTRKMIFMK